MRSEKQSKAKESIRSEGHQALHTKQWLQAMGVVVVETPY